MNLLPENMSCIVEIASLIIILSKRSCDGFSSLSISWKSQWIRILRKPCLFNGGGGPGPPRGGSLTFLFSMRWSCSRSSYFKCFLSTFFDCTWSCIQTACVNVTNVINITLVSTIILYTFIFCPLSTQSSKRLVNKLKLVFSWQDVLRQSL